MMYITRSGIFSFLAYNYGMLGTAQHIMYATNIIHMLDHYIMKMQFRYVVLKQHHARTHARIYFI
jgi:hypothetical protein